MSLSCDSDIVQVLRHSLPGQCFTQKSISFPETRFGSDQGAASADFVFLRLHGFNLDHHLRRQIFFLGIFQEAH